MKARKLLLFIIIFVQYKDNNKLIMIAIIIDARKKRNEDIPDSEIDTYIIYIDQYMQSGTFPGQKSTK